MWGKKLGIFGLLTRHSNYSLGCGIGSVIMSHQFLMSSGLPAFQLFPGGGSVSKSSPILLGGFGKQQVHLVINSSMGPVAESQMFVFEMMGCLFKKEMHFRVSSWGRCCLRLVVPMRPC
jgi:hypothetical protein